MNTEYNISNHDELQQMREQIATLRSKLETQQIVSEKLILSAVKDGVKKINRMGVIYLIYAIVALPYCSWAFSQVGFSGWFILGTILFLSLCVFGTLYIHKGLRNTDTSRQNMVEVGKRVARLRKQYGLWHFVTVPLLFVWLYFCYLEICTLYPDPTSRTTFLIAGVVGGLIGVFFGLRMHFKVVHMADEILGHIKDLQEE
ncbi:MAG: hypothetical protein IKV33_07400 [Alistipes sp.]|nr:hypothetical protein [Alistipes sp.]